MWQKFFKSIKRQNFGTLRNLYTSSYVRYTTQKYGYQSIESLLRVCKPPLGFGRMKNKSGQAVRTKSSKSSNISSDDVNTCKSEATVDGKRISLQGQFKSFETVFYLVSASLPKSAVSHYNGFAKNMGMEGLFDMVTANLSTQSVNYLIELNKFPHNQFAELIDKSKKKVIKNSESNPVYEPSSLNVFVTTFDSAVKKVHSFIKFNNDKNVSINDETKSSEKVKSDNSTKVKAESLPSTKLNDSTQAFLSDERIWMQIENQVNKTINDCISTKMQNFLKINEAEKKFPSKDEIAKLENNLNRIMTIFDCLNATEYVKNDKFDITISALNEDLNRKVKNCHKKSKVHSNKNIFAINHQLKLAAKHLKEYTTNSVSEMTGAFRQEIKKYIKQSDQTYENNIKRLEARNVKFESSYLRLKKDFERLQSSIENPLLSDKIKSLETDLRAISNITDQFVTQEIFDTAIQQITKAEQAKKDVKALKVGEYVIIDSFQTKILASTMPEEMCKQDVVQVLKKLKNTKRFSRTINKLGKKGFEVVGGSENSVFMCRSPKAFRRQRRKNLAKLLLLVISVTVGLDRLRGSGYFDQDRLDWNQEKSKLEWLIGPMYTYKRE